MEVKRHGEKESICMRKSNLIAGIIFDDECANSIVPVNTYMPLENDNWVGFTAIHPFMSDFCVYFIIPSAKLQKFCKEGSSETFKPEILTYKKYEARDFDCILDSYNPTEQTLYINIAPTTNHSKTFLKIVIHKPLDLLIYLKKHANTHRKSKNYSICVCKDSCDKENLTGDKYLREIEKKWMAKLLKNHAAIQVK